MNRLGYVSCVCVCGVESSRQEGFPFFLKLTIGNTFELKSLNERIKKKSFTKLVNTLGLKSGGSWKILCYNCIYERVESGHHLRRLECYRFHSQSYV